MTNGLITADKRMTLGSIQQTGSKPVPPRIMIYGPQKIGKSTFGASAPNPIFIPIEDGLNWIKTDAFPQPQSFQDVLDALDALGAEAHSYRTIVVDSLDWLERLIFKLVCQVGIDTDKGVIKKDSIEGYGYGKGYVEALRYWTVFIERINGLRDHRGMASVLIAHSHIKKLDAPDQTTSYDRYQPKLNNAAVSYLQEAVDVIGFANLDATVVKQDAGFNQTKGKAVGFGTRTLHMQERPQFVAGNRMGLPPSIPLSWEAFAAAFAAATGPKASAEPVTETVTETATA